MEEYDESNTELEDTNTRLEGRALHAEGQVDLLTQQLLEASAQVSTPQPHRPCCPQHGAMLTCCLASATEMS